MDEFCFCFCSFNNWQGECLHFPTCNTQDLISPLSTVRQSSTRHCSKFLGESCVPSVVWILYWTYFWGCCFQRWIYEQMGQSSKVTSWHCFRSILLTSLLQAVPPKSKLMPSFALTDISRIAFSMGFPVRKYQHYFFCPAYILPAPSFSTAWSGTGLLSFKLMWNVVFPPYTVDSHC